MPGIEITGRWITAKSQRLRRIALGLSPLVTVGYLKPSRLRWIEATPSSMTSLPRFWRFSSVKSNGSKLSSREISAATA